jgi:hypothetical protein
MEKKQKRSGREIERDRDSPFVCKTTRESEEETRQS